MQNYTVSQWKEDICGVAVVNDMKQKFDFCTDDEMMWCNEALKSVACFIVWFWSHLVRSD